MDFGTITELFTILKDYIMKSTLKDLQSLFTTVKVTGYSKISKYQSSKKGAKHNHNLSFGQKKHADFMNPNNWKQKSFHSALNFIIESG